MIFLKKVVIPDHRETIIGWKKREIKILKLRS